MRLTGLIIATICLAYSVLVGVFVGNETRQEGAEAVEYFKEEKAQAKKEFGAAMAKQVEEFESKASRQKWGGLIMMLGGVVAFGLLLVTVLKKPLIIGFATAMAVAAILAIVVNPSIPRSELELGSDPRKVALLFAIPAFVGAIGAFLHYMGWKKRSHLAKS